MQKKIAVALSAALVSGAVGFTAVAAAANGEPGWPQWVKQDGTLDREKVPDTLPLLDSEGKVVPGKRFQYRDDVTTPPIGGPQVPDTAGEQRSVDEDGAEVIRD
jgi:hypothetical protein